MVGGEALAEDATVERVHRFVGHLGDAPVAIVVGLAGDLQPLGYLVLVGVDGNLHLVHNGAEVRVKTSVKNLSEVLEVEALLRRRLADADPGDVPLAYVLHSRGGVEEVVDLAFQHRLEVLLHLAPGHLHHDAQVHGPAHLHVLEAGADDLDLVILDLVQRLHVKIFEGTRVLAAELDPHIGSAHPLALEGGTVGHGDGHLGDLNLHSPHLDASLHQPAGLLRVILALDVVEGHAHHVLIEGDAGGQNLGNDGVGDGGEAIVESPCRRGIF